MIKAATAKVIPINEIKVITLTPPSERRARKKRQAINHSKRAKGGVWAKALLRLFCAQSVVWGGEGQGRATGQASQKKEPAWITPRRPSFFKINARLTA
ncbi:MAG: hypothetical protein ACJA06_002018 [Halocynthiibacter sp.]|jgi:hypothetical protein